MPPLSLPAHFGPAAKDGGRGRRESKAGKEIAKSQMECGHARAKRYEIHMGLARAEASEGSPVAKKERKSE